jgi:hypothetical protein
MNVIPNLAPLGRRAVCPAAPSRQSAPEGRRKLAPGKARGKGEGCSPRPGGAARASRINSLLFGIGVCAAVAGWGQRALAASAAGIPKSGYFEYTQTAPLPAGRPMETDQKLWFKGQSYRQENVSNGSKIITLGGPDGTFAILPGRPDALKLSGPMHQNVAGIPGLPVLDSASIQRFAKRVGAAKVGKYQTEVYESRTVLQSAPGPKGQKAPTRQTIVTRFWIARDLPAPVKVSVPSMRPGSGPVVTVLKAAHLNPAIPDSMFRVPKGMKVSTPPPPHQVSIPPARAGGKK